MSSTTAAETGGSRRAQAASRSLPRLRLWHRVSLRLVLVVALAVLLTSGFSLYTAVMDQRAALSQISSEGLRLARAAALFQDDMVQQTRDTLFALGAARVIREGDWTACAAFLGGELQARGLYTNLGVADRKGDVVCSGLPLRRPVNVADRLYFKRTMASRSFSMGGYQVGRLTGVPAINFAVPVFDTAGGVKYVVYAALDLNWFTDVAAKLQLPPGGTLDVFDSNGVILVAYPDTEQGSTPEIYYRAAIPAVVRHGAVTTERAGWDGVRRIYGITRLSVAPAYADTYVSVGIPVAPMLAIVRHAFLRNLGGVGLVTLFAVLLALGGAVLYVQRPLDALSQAAQRLAAGDLKARAGSVSRGGELRPVIATFDDMASTLERRTAALHASEESYRSLVDRVPVGLFRTSADGRFLQLNPAGLEILGCPDLETAAKLNIGDVYVDPEDRRRFRALIERDGIVEAFEFRLRRPDGSIIWVRDRTRVVQDAGGAVLYFEGFLEDVTREKQAVEERERRHAERDSFHEFSVRLRAAQTSRDMYPIIVEQTRKLLGADHVTLNLLAPDRRQFVHAHWTGLQYGKDVSPTFDVEGSCSGEVIASGRSRVSHDLMTDRFGPGMNPADYKEFGPRVIVPVRTDAEAIGTLVIVRRREPAGEAFTESDVRLAEGIAEVGGSAIRRAELAESLARRVATLTALYGSAQRLAATLDHDQLAGDIVRMCVDSFGFRMASLGYLEAGGCAAVAAHYPPDADGARTLAGRPIDPREIDADTCARLRGGGPPIVLQNLVESADHPAWGNAALAAGMRSAAFVPLTSRSTPFGFLALYSDETGWFTTERVEFLITYAHQAAAALQNARLFDAADRRMRELEALNDIDRAVRGSLDLRVILHVLLDKTAQQLHADAVSVFLLDPDTQTLSYAAARGFRSDAIRYARLRVGEGYVGQVALTGRPVEAECLNGSAESQLGTHVRGEGFVSFHAVPLITKGVVTGVLSVLHRSTLRPTPEWRAFFEALAGQAATAIDNVTLFDSLRQANSSLRMSYDQTIEGWSRALDLRDHETEGHSQRVAHLTLVLARALSVPESDMVHIRRGALLHDIGKMGVPDAILLKPGPLTDQESEIMRHHPAHARHLLSVIGYLSPALDIPYSHHEKWDGTGYPRGLSGYQIPLAARIFTVADVWDALRSDRPYRQAWSVERVRAHIRDQAGKHFDPQVVTKFLELLDRGEVPERAAPEGDLSAGVAARRPYAATTDRAAITLASDPTGLAAEGSAQVGDGTHEPAA